MIRRTRYRADVEMPDDRRVPVRREESEETAMSGPDAIFVVIIGLLVFGGWLTFEMLR